MTNQEWARNGVGISRTPIPFLVNILESTRNQHIPRNVLGILGFHQEAWLKVKYCDLETIVEEGGNKSLYYLLAQAVDIEKNPRELQYRNILQLKDSNPKSFQEWQIAMEAEIKALNDQDVWELVDLPQNHKPIKCRWV